MAQEVADQDRRHEDLPLRIDPMRVRDLSSVLDIEKRSFTAPWSRNAFLSELLENDRAYYFAARVGERIVGYIGVWLVAGEGHITNVAVHPDFRNRGIGRRLLHAVADMVKERGGNRLTLEVRRSNRVAHSLYRSLGFMDAGIRKGYYRDNNEDAIIMWRDL